jgi:hypothetical protein
LAGMDKRVFAVDPSDGRYTFCHQLESKALGVAPNPADCNLVMVQTGSVFFELANLSYCLCKVNLVQVFYFFTTGTHIKRKSIVIVLQCPLVLVA